MRKIKIKLIGGIGILSLFLSGVFGGLLEHNNGSNNVLELREENNIDNQKLEEINSDLEYKNNTTLTTVRKDMKYPRGKTTTERPKLVLTKTEALNHLGLKGNEKPYTQVTDILTSRRNPLKWKRLEWEHYYDGRHTQYGYTKSIDIFELDYINKIPFAGEFVFKKRNSGISLSPGDDEYKQTSLALPYNHDHWIISGTIDIKYERSYYDFGNAKINIPITNQNLLSGNFKKNILPERFTNPFYTKNEDYYDVQRDIRDYSLIDSEFNIPLDYADIYFYDEFNNFLYYEEGLSSDEINFKVIDHRRHENLNIKGETEILKFSIPFLDIDLKSENINNVYNFGDPKDITDNENRSEGIWEGGQGVLRTNVPYNLNISHENIKSIKIGNAPHNLLPGETLDYNHQQILDNKSQDIEEDIILTTRNNYEGKFRYEYQAEVFTPLEIVPYNDFNHIIRQEKMTLENDERIYTASVVDSPFSINNPPTDQKVFKGDEIENEGIWEEYANEYTKEQIYGFSYINEYGNNSFEVVEYNTKPIQGVHSDKLVKGDALNEKYTKAKDIASENGIDGEIYNTLSAQEISKHS